MPQVHLTAEQQSMLSRFIDQEPSSRSPIPDALAGLLEQLMNAVNVRRLELVEPEGVRELLRSSFVLIKMRHLYDNNLLSNAQFQMRLEILRGRVAKTK